MDPVYRITSKVSYSRVCRRGRLTLCSAMNYMQDCGAFQMEDLGRGAEYFKNNGQALFITAWQVDIDEMPFIGKEIYVDTWIYGYDALSCYRNYLISGPEGKRYIRAYASGAFIDVAAGRPSRLTAEAMTCYPMKNRMDMEYLPRKIKLPASWDEEGRELRVTKRHLDTNMHVNNSKYIAIAEEQLPDDFETRRVRVEYKKPAGYGDIIIPKIKYTDEGCVAALCPPDGSPYAIAEFRRQGV